MRRRSQGDKIYTEVLLFTSLGAGTTLQGQQKIEALPVLGQEGQIWISGLASGQQVNEKEGRDEGLVCLQKIIKDDDFSTLCHNKTVCVCVCLVI